MSFQRLTKSAIINVISDAIFQAAKPLVRDFGEMQHLIHSQRGIDRFVEKAKEIVVKTLTQVLQEKYAAYKIVLPDSMQAKINAAAKAAIQAAEETTDGIEPGQNEDIPVPAEAVVESGPPAHAFILSPLIGEQNFRHALPQFAIGVTVRKKGKIAAVAIYDPIKDELFWAEKKEGAHLNSKKLRVSPYPQARGSRLIIETIARNAPTFMDHIHFYAKAQKNCDALLTLGAPALSLAYVAAGRVDGALCYTTPEGEFEGAALLIKEAGGRIAQVKEEGLVLASNNEQVDQFLISRVKETNI